MHPPLRHIILCTSPDWRLIWWAGKWVWKGTQTLQFEPEFRFPKSTDYTVKALISLLAAL
jgi:hypothetical protein